MKSTKIWYFFRTSDDKAMASTIKKRSPKKSQGDDSLKSSSIKRGIIKNQPKSQFDSSKDNFQSFQSEDLEDIHEFQDDLNSPTNEKYVKSKNLINRCEGAFHQLQILKDSWIRITIKNVKINDVVFNLPTLCYLGQVVSYSFCILVFSSALLFRVFSSFN